MDRIRPSLVSRAMPQGIPQPLGQKRLTNVAVVRIKKGGKRFEIACYKNKVVNFRNGVEKDVDEVLQTDSVFLSVSKGILANEKDLQKCFNTTDVQKVCAYILSKGQLQVSDKERRLAYDSAFLEVATLVSARCLNPQTHRPYPVSTVEQAMRERLHFAVNPDDSVKKQALKVMRDLKEVLPIERAKMKVSIQFDDSMRKRTKCETFIDDLVTTHGDLVVFDRDESDDDDDEKKKKKKKKNDSEANTTY